MSEATPRPWERTARFIYKAGKGSLVICELQGSGGQYVERQELRLDDPRFAEIHANGDFIVRAVNAHDELLAACEAALPLVYMLGVKMNGPLEIAETHTALVAAIAKAKGT